MKFTKLTCGATPCTNGDTLKITNEDNQRVRHWEVFKTLTVLGVNRLGLVVEGIAGPRYASSSEVCKTWDSLSGEPIPNSDTPIPNSDTPRPYHPIGF